MIPIPSGVRSWITTAHTDMRRCMQSLALTVQERLKRAILNSAILISSGAAAVPISAAQMPHMLEGIAWRNPQLIWRPRSAGWTRRNLRRVAF
ncbi:hypothetical protein DB459_11565 [Bradyrhizobium sp. WD16]|nr:hypothetical protein DB459_11565 [Bradyrhizobium sp. WD16]